VRVLISMWTAKQGGTLRGLPRKEVRYTRKHFFSESNYSRSCWSSNVKRSQKGITQN